MKLKASVAPVALLVAGTFGSSAANATTTVDNTTYTPSFPFGSVDITLAGASSPQFTFSDSLAKYYLQGNGGATVAAPGSSTYVTSLQTANWVSSTDGNYGLRFSDDNGVHYQGFAEVINGGSEIDKITYSSVPEPSTWAMMALGLGLAGGALRRSRRRQPALASA